MMITSANKMFSQSFQLDKNVTSVNGILVTADLEDLLYYRGTQKIELNSREIFPEDYESKLLITGINISPNDKYYRTGGLPVGNGILKVEYRDSDHSRMKFEPYLVSIYLDYEQSDL